MHTRRFPFLREAVFSLAVSLGVTSAWATSQIENLPNFQKVDEQVYRGAQPTSSGFKNLADRGIKTVIDLREIGERSRRTSIKRSRI